MSNNVKAILAAIEDSDFEVSSISFTIINPNLAGTAAVVNNSATSETDEKPKPAAKKPAAKKPAAKKPAAKAAPKDEPEEEDDKRDPDDVGESDDDGEDAPTVDVTQVQDAARAVVRAKKPEILKGLCEEYGVKKISDADPSDFAAILSALEEAVA